MSLSNENVILFCEVSASSASGERSRELFSGSEHVKSSLLLGVEQALGHSVQSEACATTEILDRVRVRKRETPNIAVVWFSRTLGSDSITSESMRQIEACASEIGEGSLFLASNAGRGDSVVADVLRRFHHYAFPQSDTSLLLETEFWRAMNDLVEDISRVLRGGMGATDGPSIFLAPVPDYVVPIASRLRHDLESRGFYVTSNAALEPLNEFEAVLSASKLSVHLFGRGIAASNAPRQPAEYFRAALAYAKTHPNFRILGWTDFDPTPAATNSQLVNQILGESQEFSVAAEVIQSNIEDFKSLLYDRLGFSGVAPVHGGEVTNERSRVPPASAVPGNGMEIYVIYDPRDTETAAPVASFLQDHGLGVLLPEFPTDQSRLRAIHNENLRRCDGAVIIYGGVQEQWVRMKQQDLLRSPALGRQKGLSAKAVFLCSKQTEGKLRFSAPDMMVLNGFDSTHGLAALGPFLQRLSAT
jgi:hypothetical protein